MVLTRRLFLTGLGAVFGLAFGSLWVQLDGLFSSGGILPAARTLEQAQRELGTAALWRVPSLVWLSAGDAALHALCAAGVALSGALAAGLAPTPVLALLWLLYLSLAAVGAPFLAYQWDVLLLETGLLATALAPRQRRPRDAWATPVPRAPVWLLRWLLFRLCFLSGAAKLLSGDPAWRDLSALGFHPFTQPLPAWTSAWVHELPGWCHRAATGAVLAVELAAPVGIFGPRSLRLLAAAALAALQLAILATGNYGFFNLLVLCLCLLLLDDRALRCLCPRRWRGRLPGARPESLRPPSRAGRIASAGLAAGVLLLTVPPTLERLGWRGAWPGPLAALRRAAAPLRSFNGYGLFAVMTVRRPEIILEGSPDGREWRAYDFRDKPGRPDRRPRFVQPHQPRLDWQMWFASQRGCARAAWFHHFAQRLLEGSPQVRGLLAQAPFGETPPRYLRSTLYDYRFAPREQRRRGVWWTRERIGPYCPVLTLRDGELAVARPAPG